MTLTNRKEWNENYQADQKESEGTGKVRFDQEQQQLSPCLASSRLHDTNTYSINSSLKLPLGIILPQF